MYHTCGNLSYFPDSENSFEKKIFQEKSDPLEKGGLSETNGGPIRVQLLLIQQELPNEGFRKFLKFLTTGKSSKKSQKSSFPKKIDFFGKIVGDRKNPRSYSGSASQNTQELKYRTL